MLTDTIVRGKTRTPLEEYDSRAEILVYSKSIYLSNQGPAVWRVLIEDWTTMQGLHWVRRMPEQKLEALAAQWKRETAHLSLVSKKAMHPAYQAIIGLGPWALPFILKKLREAPDHWFWALEAITGQNPVPEEHFGNIPAMTEDWLAWGDHEGYGRALA